MLIACLLLLGVAAAVIRRVDVFAAFAQGAKDGLDTAVRVAPYLIATMVALSAAGDSGLMARLCRVIQPAARLLGLPEGAMPLLLLRPLSGSASLGALNAIMAEFGPDSRTSLVAGAMMGSGETVFYTCALYLSAAGIKNSRYIIPVSLVAWIAGCAVAGLFFR